MQCVDLDIIFHACSLKKADESEVCSCLSRTSSIRGCTDPLILEKRVTRSVEDRIVIHEVTQATPIFANFENAGNSDNTQINLFDTINILLISEKNITLNNYIGGG